MEIAVARFVSLLALSCTIAGCTAPPPTASGDNSPASQASAVAQDGMLEVSDGAARCRGDYDSTELSRSLQIALQCDDGRTGTATLTASADRTAGSGIVSLSDGTQWEFLFGRATELI